MTTTYFPFITDKILLGDVNSPNQLAYRFYEPNKKILGKTMAEHLRIAVCYWHTFCSEGADQFGGGSRILPWNQANDPLQAAENKLDAAFEFFTKLNIPFFTFHDRDLAPEGKTLRESVYNLQHMVELVQKKIAQSGVKLLWGTANCFSNKRYMAGAATNPNAEVFAYAAAQVKYALEATNSLGGSGYVLWGGREGYDSLFNTDIKQELEHLARFLALVVEHKNKIGFKGDLWIEPKPCEPTKHQYDFDAATVYAFLQKFGLEKEFKLNIEVNHATLAGHSFLDEVCYAAASGQIGSFDLNRGDPQNGWDTDQFANSAEEMAIAMYHILKHGGLKNGGFNFDAKVRRQSIDLEDLFYGHIGAIDVLAKSLLIAAKMLENDKLQQMVDKRYQSWQGAFGQEILAKKHSLDSLAKYIMENNIEPAAVSGQQELGENIYNQYLWSSNEE